MKPCFLKFALVWMSTLLGLPFYSFGQGQKIPEPSLPGYSGFHSNLGIQEIVEVGVPLSEKRKVSSPVSNPVNNQVTQALNPRVAQPRSEESSQVPSSTNSKDSISITPQLGLRAYRTSNVLRTANGTEKGSGVFESNIGVGISTEAKQVSSYITLIPRLDLMMQWANYGEQSDLLNYRFGLVKGGLALGFPNDWSAGITLDYNVLHNQKTGDKTFDAWSPAISLQKLHPLSDSSFIMGDLMIRRSSTEQTVFFPAAGIFPNSGDNRQFSASLTYVKVLGVDGKFTFMPRMAYSHTQYLKSPSKGRDDRLFSIGASLMYQWTEWLSIQTFLTNVSMSSDSINNFSATDFGLSLSASHRF